MRILKVASIVAALLAPIAGLQAQTVQTTLNYPNGVTAVAVDFLANRVYVLAPNFNADGSNAVQVLDGQTDNVLATYSVPVSGAIAVNVLTGTVYLGGSEGTLTGAVVALNPNTGAILATIPVATAAGSGIAGLAVDPLTNRIFVSDDTNNTIDVINGRTNTLTASISLNGQTPAGIAVNFATHKVYAALNDNQVAILSEKTNALTFATYGSATTGIAVDPSEGLVYVTDAVFDVPTVGVLSGKGVVKASIPVGHYPTGVDVDFISQYVFVANQADGTITKIDGDEHTVVSTTTVPANTVAVNVREKKVYAVGSTTVTVLSEN